MAVISVAALAGAGVWLLTTGQDAQRPATDDMVAVVVLDDPTPTSARVQALADRLSPVVQDHPDLFAGLWPDGDTLHVAAVDLSRAKKLTGAADVIWDLVRYTTADLTRVARQVDTLMSGNAREWRDLTSYAIDPERNLVLVGTTSASDEVRRSMRFMFGEKVALVVEERFRE
jgi:hypothetical protein